MSVPNIAEISYNKLLNNLNEVKHVVGNVKICAVVKSDAYGHGIVEISNALYPFVNCFAVSLDGECAALRHAGIDKEILLLTPPVRENVERLISLKITLTVSNYADLPLIYSAAKTLNVRANVHLKLNTGMNRLGLDTVKEVEKCVNYAAKRSKYIRITGCYSHLGLPENDNYACEQLRAFKEMSAIVKAYDEKVTLHLSSSGGLLKGGEYLFDMVRVGILLYGYLPYETDKIKVTPVMKIYARAVTTRLNVKNKRLMYGNFINAERDITIVRNGYGDGFRRIGTPLVIGNECMDLCAVKRMRKKYVVIMNDASTLAKAYGTIAYEVLVNVTKRSKRIYK